jgi:hypothetical protein
MSILAIATVAALLLIADAAAVPLFGLAQVLKVTALAVATPAGPSLAAALAA